VLSLLTSGSKFVLMPPSLLMINVYVLNVSQSPQVTTFVYANMCFQTMYIFGKQSEYFWEKKKLAA